MQSIKNENNGDVKQVVITLPLLEGLDGVKKMSKSLSNYIAIDDLPSEIFGKGRYFTFEARSEK